LGPIPNHQSPIPNPQSPFQKILSIYNFGFENILFFILYFLKIFLFDGR